jgi:hypothetical protein
MRTTIVWILVAAAAAQSAAKAAWDDKVSAYKTCRAQDRAADMYRSNLEAAAKDIPTPTATASCADSGPYVAPVTPVESNSKLSRRIHLPERPPYRRVRTCRRPKCPRPRNSAASEVVGGRLREAGMVGIESRGRHRRSTRVPQPYLLPGIDRHQNRKSTVAQACPIA